ncbi:MAG: hypothetical protein ACRES6_08635 [Steroidobacteraceae bacterium]
MTADEADDWAALEDAEIGQRVRRGIEHARGRDAPLPAAQDRAFTVSAECALRAATEQRIEADHAREHSVVAQAIPGYGRLP